MKAKQSLFLFLMLITVSQLRAAPTVVFQPIKIKNVSNNSVTFLIDNIIVDSLSVVDEKGFVWGVSSSPNVFQGQYVSCGFGLDSFSLSIVTNANTTYFVRAYVRIDTDYFYSKEDTFHTAPVGIGEYYQGGSLAYVFQPGDTNIYANSYKYLKTESNGFIVNDNILPISEWGCVAYDIEHTYTDFGSGFYNTNEILTLCLIPKIAAAVCDSLAEHSYNHYADWFLPSRDELKRISTNRVLTGGYTLEGSEVVYSTSSAFDDYTNWAVNFNTGLDSSYLTYKNTPYQIRAARMYNSKTFNIPVEVSADQLKLWMPLDSNANDYTGNSNNVISNNIIHVPDRNSKNKRAYQFDSQHCNSSVKTSLNRLWNQYSISFWMSKLGTGCLNETVIDFKGGYNLSFGDLRLDFQNDSIARVRTIGVFGDTVDINLLPMKDSNWYHIVFTNDGRYLRAYQNSILVDSGFISGYGLGSATLSDTLTLGSSNDKASVFNGRIDEVGVWNKIISKTEMNDLNFNCDLNFTKMPVNTTGFIDSSIYFVVNTNSNSSNFQWQVDTGKGYINLNNTIIYSHVNNDTLIIKRCLPKMNTYLFRCRISEGSCMNFSDEALLSVTQFNGINSVPPSTINISPNPTSNNIFISGLSETDDNLAILYNVQGKVIMNFKAENNVPIDLSLLENGVHLLKVGQVVKRVVKMFL